VEQPSVLSDALLRHLIAVGHVDILVGLPTLNNAATVTEIVRAVHVSFARDFPRLRTVLINSDGGSTDGTPELVRNASFNEAETVITSHALRTIHRVVAPYHGLPGKLSALRTVFAAADLTQAKAVAVLDAGGPATTPERVAELVWPILREGVEFLAPRHCRHPREGTLVTQFARPLVRATYGVALEEPLGLEFACSGRFASYCLEEAIWEHEVARFAIDLRLRTEAIAQRFAVGQIWRPPSTPLGPRPMLREAVQQVMLATFESLAAHERYWTAQAGVTALRTWGSEAGPPAEAPAMDADALAVQARNDLRELRPLFGTMLDERTAATLYADLSRPAPGLDDELWVTIVYALLAARRRSAVSADHLAGLFVPLYLWRASAFHAHTEAEPDAIVARRLDALNETFERLKPQLVGQWTAAQ
jgi:hypothetical protein